MIPAYHKCAKKSIKVEIKKKITNISFKLFLLSNKRICWFNLSEEIYKLLRNKSKF